MNSPAQESPGAQSPVVMGASQLLTLKLDSLQVMAIMLCGAAIVGYLFKGAPKDSKKFPVINPSSSLELLGISRRKDWAARAGDYIEQGVRQFQGRPFKVKAEEGEVIILPAEWAHQIRNEPNLSFMKAVHEMFHADFSPFKPFASGTSDDALLQAVARKQLTKYLNKVTEPLSIETAYAIDLNIGAKADWEEVAMLKMALLDIVARISSCVFIGSKLCRNEAWLDITKSYTVESFLAAEDLRLYPKWLRGIMQHTLSRCKKALESLEKARALITPVIEERRRLIREGEYKPLYSDAIDWFEEEAAGRPYDPTMCQMILSTAAIHTTTDLVNETILRLAEHPQLVNELRKELISVLSTDGWTKTALFNMKLLDSTIKESQRIRKSPISMMRAATSDVKLPDGSTLRRGERTLVSTAGMMEPSFYEEPERFDPHRFIRLRETPGKENLAHLVSTGQNHLGFGHGKHSCPGRFFAANEIKVLICHIVMKYEMKLPDGYERHFRTAGTAVQSDPMSRIILKSRTPEIDMDGLKF